MTVSLTGDQVPGVVDEPYLCLSATHSYVSDAYGSGGAESDGCAYSGSYVLMPAYGMQSNYGIATDGPNRAATDPWIRQQHPDLAAAGARVVEEEQDFLALDEPVSSHAQPNCSIAKYTSEKIYEYYAALEMVYKIATDDDFRRMIAGQIHSAYTQSALANQTAADMLKWHAGNLDDDIEEAERRERGDKSLMDRVGSLFGFEDEDELALWLMGYEDKQEYIDSLPEGVEYVEMSAAELKARRDRLLSEAQIHQDAAIAKLKSFFVKIWDQIKRRYTECGLMYAIITTGIDGAFLAAEFGTGVAVLRGLKFVRKILPSGRIRVEIHTIEGRKLGEADWSKEALAAKYGEPQQTHVGGFEPDANRQIPDRSADDILRDKREREAAEQRARREDERADGSYRDRNDPDGVRRAPDGEAMVQDRDGNWTRISEADNNTKGRFGEMMADDWAAKQDPPWVKVNGPNNTMDTPGHQGLDSVYRNPNPPPDYFVTDAKYGTAGLSTLKDKTRQMSPKWIRERVREAFDRRTADRILDDHEAGILRVYKNGNVTWESLSNQAWRDADR